VGPWDGILGCTEVIRYTILAPMRADLNLLAVGAVLRAVCPGAAMAAPGTGGTQI